MDVAAGAGAEEVEVVGAMFPGPDGEPPPGVTAAAAALRSRQPAAFSLRLPLQPSAEADDDQAEVTIELYCALPATYPIQPPQFAVRGAEHEHHQLPPGGPRSVLSRAAADDLQRRLALHVDAHCPAGEGRLFEAIRWLQENAAASFAWTAQPLTTTTDKNERGEEERHWLWSHHIYGKKKRRIMPEWASELRLRGACLAGKPGLIVIEGDSQRVREFVRRVRAMPWQRMVSKLEERLPQEDDSTKRFPAFKEVTFDGLKEILERLGIEHRLGEVLGLRHHPEEQTVE